MFRFTTRWCMLKLFSEATSDYQEQARDSRKHGEITLVQGGSKAAFSQRKKPIASYKSTYCHDHCSTCTLLLIRRTCSSLELIWRGGVEANPKWTDLSILKCKSHSLRVWATGEEDREAPLHGQENTLAQAGAEELEAAVQGGQWRRKGTAHRVCCIIHKMLMTWMRAEWHKRRGKERARKRVAFRANPFGFS